ncbi:unnamed protein product, partial [Brassica rapa]
MTSNTRREDEQPPEPTSLITSFPKDAIFDILTRLPRYEYSTLSLVSKQFRSLVRSPELYERRSLIGVTEPFFYALFYDSQSRNTRWNILHRKANGNLRLALIHSLPAMDDYGSFVAVGSSIYVFGGSDDHTKYRALKIDCRIYVFGGYDDHTKYYALSIDCRFHTVEHLPKMPVPMSNTIADIIDGRIYVIGDHYYDKSKKVMLVFNTETQLWELGTIKPNIEFGYSPPSSCVAMADKMYINDYHKSYVYEPKKSKWEKEEMLSSNKWRNACVVDNILYYYDYFRGHKLRTYDSKQRYWGTVKGLDLEELVPKRNPHWIDTVRSYSGKLALIFTYEGRTPYYLWSAEISLERRQGGEILGKVEWCDEV